MKENHHESSVWPSAPAEESKGAILQLLNALRPFAALYAGHRGEPDFSSVFESNGLNIMVADVRRAALLVESWEKPADPVPAPILTAPPAPIRADAWADNRRNPRPSARTALAATLGMDSRELSEYRYKDTRTTRAIYCAGGAFWATGKTAPADDVGEKWVKAPEQFWAEKAGTIVWMAKEILSTRTRRGK